MATLDDLLSKRRRGALSAAEERRLRVAVQSSSEYELSLLAGDAFDRDGAPAPGDAELVQRIALQVEQRWYQRFARRGLRKPLPLLVVVPVFLAGAAAASYGGYRAVQALTEAAALPASAAFAHGPSAHPASVRPVAVPAAPEHAAPTIVEPVAVGALEGRRGPARHGPSRSVPPRATPRSRGDAELAEPSAREASVTERATVAGSAVVSRRHPAHGEAASTGVHALAAAASQIREPGALPERTSPTLLHAGREASALETAREATPSRSEPDSAREGEAPSEVTSVALDDASAAALFERARELRKRDWPAAASLYEQLISRHPASPEAGISEMALGKWSLARGRAQEALTWFRAHQRRPSSALAAEAIWGEAQALERLGMRALASGPWRRLIEQYPASPYARVARQQLRHAE